MEIACFFAVPAGRPRRTTLRPTMTSASSNHARLRDGASSGSRQTCFEERFFAGIRLPHRYESRLAIVPTVVRARHVPFAEQQSGKGEVEAAFLQRQRSLGRIKDDAHELSYIQ